MASARVANDATGKMVLCIGTEPVVVYTDEDGQPTQTPHFCPDCRLMSLDVVLPDMINAPSAVEVNPFLSMSYVVSESHIITHTYLSRAPPDLI